MKKVLITGITGQMGYICAQEALKRGYGVVGTARYCTNLDEKLKDRKHLVENKNFILECLDLEDQCSIDSILSLYKPDYLINTAAMSHVGKSWQIPEATMNITGLGVLRILEGIRKHSNDTKMIQCSTSEMFGKYKEGKISEESPFCSRSPYAVAKTAAHLMIDVYRESHDIKACCVIMFNCESFKRGIDFFTRKITYEMGRIYRGEKDTIELGNLNFCRDWGYAGDYAQAMFIILESDRCDDYILSTGETTTGRSFVEMAFDYANRRLGEDFFSFDKHIKTDSDEFNRPNDVKYLRGDSSKIEKDLGWKPTYDILNIIKEMVDYDVFGEQHV